MGKKSRKKKEKCRISISEYKPEVKIVSYSDFIKAWLLGSPADVEVSVDISGCSEVDK